MKRVLFVWILSLAACAGSFGVLLAEDRKLGLPLPYTIPLAFLGMLIAGPVLQMIAAKLWPEPRLVVRVHEAPSVQSVSTETTPPSAPAPTPPPARARATAQGVVLFDLSRVKHRRHAA